MAGLTLWRKAKRAGLVLGLLSTALLILVEFSRGEDAQE